MNHEIQSDIKHNARKENVFAYLNDSGRHSLFNSGPKQMESCIRLQIKIDNNQQVIDVEDLIYSSFDDRLDDAKSSAAEKGSIAGGGSNANIASPTESKKSKKIVPTLVSSSGTTHTHLASVATKKKIKKDKSSRSRTRGLAGVIERIEQREAEFSSGTICIL